MGSYANAWCTECNGTTFVTVSHVLLEWEEFVAHHDSSWQTTVKPVCKGHPWCKAKVVFPYRWPSHSGSRSSSQTATFNNRYNVSRSSIYFVITYLFIGSFIHSCIYYFSLLFFIHWFIELTYSCICLFIFYFVFNYLFIHSFIHFFILIV